jgi:hypothetical protein
MICNGRFVWVKANVLITDSSNGSVRKSWVSSEKGRRIMLRCDLTAEVKICFFIITHWDKKYTQETILTLEV